MDATSQKPEWAQSKREKDNASRVAQGLKPRRRRWPWILLGLVVVGGVAGFILLRSQPQAPAPVEAAAPEPVMQLNPVEVSTIAPQLLQQTVKVSGSMAPQRQTILGSQVAGRIETVAVRPGDRVGPGDILVQVDTESLNIQLSQQRATAQATRAQLVLAQSQLERTRDLIARGLTASSGLEQAQSSADALRANLAALEGQVNAAEIALGNATVTAPFAGIISERSVEPGQTVAAGAPLLTVVDLSMMELLGAAPVASSTLLAAGQAVSITVEGLAGRVFAGIVDRVNPVAVTGTRTIPVYISIDNAENFLRGGLFATGQIVVAEKADGLAVPKGAIREDAEGFFLLKVANGEIVRQGIEQGQEWSNGQLVEITSGLMPGDVVVTVPLTQLQPGDKVEMVEG